MTRFTAADVAHANHAWLCSCGPCALAAILDLTLDEVKPLFLPAFPGHTTPTRMFEALRRSGRRWASRQSATRGGPLAGSPWPRWGLCRVQWHGPWTMSGANPRWAYTHTHWVGCHTRGDVRSIWDVNEMSEAGADGWVLVGDWSARTVPRLTADIKRASGGWHVTHAIEVERR